MKAQQQFDALLSLMRDYIVSYRYETSDAMVADMENRIRTAAVEFAVAFAGRCVWTKAFTDDGEWWHFTRSCDKMNVANIERFCPNCGRSVEVKEW